MSLYDENIKLGKLFFKVGKAQLCVVILLQISGEANESQIMESLRRYQNRPIYVQRALYYLFGITQGFSEPRTDVIRVSDKPFDIYVGISVSC